VSRFAVQIGGYILAFLGAVFGAVLASDIEWATWSELFGNPRLILGALAAGTSAVGGLFMRNPRQAWKEWGDSRRERERNGGPG